MKKPRHKPLFKRPFAIRKPLPAFSGESKLEEWGKTIKDPLITALLRDLYRRIGALERRVEDSTLQGRIEG